MTFWQVVQILMTLSDLLLNENYMTLVMICTVMLDEHGSVESIK